MEFLVSTVIGVVVIETSFFVFHKIVDRRRFFSGFLATFILGLIVMFFSFGNGVGATFRHMATYGNNFNIWNILLIFFNMFYGYWRGLHRIFEINKKHGNL